MTGASEGPSCRTDAWWVVSVLDVLAASQQGEQARSPQGEQTWPTVLRPRSVAQRVADGRREAEEELPTGTAPGSGERLCALALPIAGSAAVRAVHWYLGSSGTVIAETACGPETSVVLVGWAPYESEPVERGGAAVPVEPGSAVRALPGALLLGIFDTRVVAQRLAELVAESAAPADTIVVGRWSLPEECTPMAMRSIVHPAPGVLRRELIAQLSEALLRAQTGEQMAEHGPAGHDRAEHDRAEQDRAEHDPAEQDALR